MEKYRHKVELFILNQNNEVLITNAYLRSNPSKTWKGVPGGGVEPNENMAKAAEREALEEVGVRAYGILSLNQERTFEIPKDNTKLSKYKGVIVHNYMGRYLREDHSLYGADNDTVTYDWYGLKEAIEMFNGDNDPVSKPFAKFRASALIEIQNRLNNQVKFKHW